MIAYNAMGFTNRIVCMLQSREFLINISLIKNNPSWIYPCMHSKHCLIASETFKTVGIELSQNVL